MTFFLDQHGCAKNQVDGELLIARLSARGYVQTFDAAAADLIIVNSCGFIESAKTESLDAVLGARKQYPNAKILLAGCLAQRYAAVLGEQLPEADGIFGNGDLDQLYRVVEPMMAGKRVVLAPAQQGVCGGTRNLLLSFAGAAYVKITEGCNNRCSFCAIPLIRGELRSRPADDIIAEIKQLVAQGVYELNLIGQDLAAYGTGRSDNVFGTGRMSLPAKSPGSDDTTTGSSNSESGLCTLLKRISALSGTFRVRLLYMHPDHFNADILPVIAHDPRLLPYFDIPFQSGDDGIIHAMHRTGSAAAYRAVVAQIRAVFPDAALRTTFLAGFPAESEAAAERTRRFLADIAPDWSGCFPYSREDDTPAAALKKQVAKKTKETRVAALVALQTDITRARLALRCGKVYDVLVEEVLSAGTDAPCEGLAIGRAWFQAPEVDGSVVIRYDCSDEIASAAVRTGRLVRVHVTASGDVDVSGDFVADSPLNAGIAPRALTFAEDIAHDGMAR